MKRPSWYRRLLLNPALRQLHAWLANSQPTRRGTYRPRLEELEDRVVPSTLVLDPKNIVISSTPVGPVPQYNLVNPGSGGTFGTEVVPLSNGNVVVTDPTVNGDAGAVYLFNGTSGALISTLSGNAGDEVGSGGITVLTNGNYVVSSPDWNGSMGAVTWASGTTGVSGTISAANSLIGVTAVAPGSVISATVTALTNGNYVVSNANVLAQKGAVTWGNGTAGTDGTVSTINSLVGTATGTLFTTSSGESFYQNGDSVGSSVTPLANGNYVVDSPFWSHNQGAVTWCNGSTGFVGVVSTADSLVGTIMGTPAMEFNNGTPYLGGDGEGQFVVGLTNGNYVVSSPYWDTASGTFSELGAVTWGNGSVGLVGTISTANSLVGASPGDHIGEVITPLNNGNYVVGSPYWDTYLGAATWGNGSTGTVGTVSAANSLVGSSPDTYVEDFVTALANGNYVVSSPHWSASGSPSNVGAVTWGNGSTGVVGVISAANSLVGTQNNDLVGLRITALTNGNYVVGSAAWTDSQGAATWGNGTTGVVGTISAANSLVGTGGAEVGFVITALTNGNYVVSGGATATWGNGSTGVVGTISAANSLIGAGPFVTALTNGSYVVNSPNWNANQGALTWGSGDGGVVGPISTSNSLVGTTVNFLAANITPLTNGNYVVSSALGNGLSPNPGFATWGNGSTGTTGTISAANSLVGTAASDGVGAAITTLPDGNYVVVSPYWNGNTGAATWVDGTSGLTLNGQNMIDANNSLLGAAAGAGAKLTVQAGPIPGAFIADFISENGGRVTIAPPPTVTVSPAYLASTLAAGTNVVLMANNDITVSDPISVVPSGSVGTLTLDAGRSILLNANLATAGGNLTLTANESKANGVYDPERDPGNAAIAMQSGVTLNTGAGTLAVDLKASTDKTNNGQGVATLLGLTAGSVTLSPATALGVTLNGTTPGDGTGSSYTQTVVNGPINLGGATLAVSDPGSFTLGQSFVILTSTQPIAGTFAGLPEGAVFTSGQTFEVSYQNDQVTLLVIPLITFSPVLLPNGTTGTAYSQTLTASGGTSPYGNFVVSAGALPAGVTLSTAGMLSGTPTAAGFFNFTMRATDASPSPGPYPGQQTFTLVVTPPGFVYDLTNRTLTITASAAQNTFTYSQATAVAPGGIATTGTFNLNGVVLSLPEAILSAVAVNAGAGQNEAVLIANDTYLGSDGQTHETRETALLGTGGGVLEKYDANGNAVSFLTLSGFQTSYAYLGRADNGEIFDSPGNDVFVTAGSYSYMTGPNIFRLISGGSSVYGYTINGGSDQAWQYDAAGSLDAFVASGTAYSYMSGTDQNGNSFFNVAVGFPVNYGISTHGNAIAYMLDSPNNDVFYAAPPTASGATTYSYMSGPGFFNVAEAFALVYSESFVGGTDYAYNYDPSHNILNSRWILLT